MGSMLDMRYQVGQGSCCCEFMILGSTLGAGADCSQQLRMPGRACCPHPLSDQVRVGQLAAGNFGVPQVNRVLRRRAAHPCWRLNKWARCRQFACVAAAMKLASWPPY